MARGSHLFPFRTQKLSLFAPKVLGWTRPGRLGRCRNPYQETRCVSFFYWIGDSLSLQGWEPPCSEGGHHVPVREAHGRNMIAEAACSRSSRRTRRRCGWHRKGLATPSCIPAEVCSICRYAAPSSEDGPFFVPRLRAAGRGGRILLIFVWFSLDFLLISPPKISCPCPSMTGGENQC